MIEKPKYWVSIPTGNKYSYHEYTNHGKIIEYRGYKDLPIGEYPYTIEYEEPGVPLYELNKTKNEIA